MLQWLVVGGSEALQGQHWRRAGGELGQSQEKHLLETTTCGSCTTDENTQCSMTLVLESRGFNGATGATVDGLA